MTTEQGFTCARCGKPTSDVDPDGRCLECPSVADEPHKADLHGSYTCRICGRYASDRMHEVDDA